MYLLSVNMIQKKRCMIFDSGMMTHEESRASLVEEWNFMLDIRLGFASICKRVVGHIHWEFFLAPQHFFSFWTVCVSFDRGHF